MKKQENLLQEKKLQKEKLLQNTWVVCLLACICCLLWGSAFPCIKIGYSLLKIGSSDTAAQILFAGLRFALAGALAVVMGSIPAKRLLVPGRKAWPAVGTLCLFQTVLQYLFFYVGLAHTSGVKASIIEAANVFLAILTASLVFRQEKLAVKKLAGCAIGFAGVVLINLSAGGLDGGMKLNGEGFILLSTVSYAVSSVLLKRYSARENPVMLSGWQFMAGGGVMIVCGLLMGGRLPGMNAAGAGMLIYLAFVSAAAYSLWGILLKYNPVSRVTVFGFANPVFGVLLSAVLLKERQAFGMRTVTALALVCAGIFIVNYEKKDASNGR